MGTHGKSSVFKIDDSTTTLRDISTALSSVDLGRKVDTVDTSTFGSSDKTYVVGLKDSTFSIEGFYDATTDSYLEGILGGAAGSFEYGPTGSTAAMIKYTGECFCIDYSLSTSIDGAIVFTATFQVTGAVTRGAYT